MSRSDVPAWASSLLVAVPSSILSCLVTLWVVDPGPDPAAAPSMASLDLDPVLRRLDVLQRRVAQRFEEPSPSGGAERPIRQEIPETARNPQDLDELLDRFERALRVVESRNRIPPLSRDVLVDHAALDSLHALATRDPDAAKRSTMLLTPDEVAARFGFPNDAGGAAEGALYWNYYHFGPDGKRDGGTLFVFRAGRVAWHEISIPDR